MGEPSGTEDEKESEMEDEKESEMEPSGSEDEMEFEMEEQEMHETEMEKESDPSGPWAPEECPEVNMDNSNVEEVVSCLRDTTVALQWRVDQMDMEMEESSKQCQSTFNQ